MNKELYKLAGSLNAISVQSYLKNTGWNRVKSKRPQITIFTKIIDNHYTEILLPLTKDFGDYELVMLEAVKLISIVEEREELQVLTDLSIAKPSDILRIRLNTEDTKEGTISFEDGFKLLENTKIALYATACDVLQPEVYHKRLSFKSADQFINQCRLGQTERGSFIASIICPFIDESKIDEIPKQYTLFDDPSEYKHSFSRKVTTRLMKSIQIINDAIENDELKKIQKGESDIVISANFLESIVNLNELSHETSGIEFTSTWSSLAPPDPTTPSKVAIQKDFVSAVDSIIDKMVPKTAHEDGEFVGKVFKVQAEPDASKRIDGEVTFTLIGEGQKSFNAKAILNSETYKEACKAHEDGKNVKIKGRLLISRRSKLIENAELTIL